MLHHYTYNDYLTWEGRWELISGIPFPMTPLPSPKHQHIAAALSAVFFAALSQRPGLYVYLPVNYKITEDTALQPDLLVVNKPIKKDFLDFPPALIAEILSPATVEKDRQTKFSVYEGQSIQYYLIISPEQEQVEVFEIENGRYLLRQRERQAKYTFSMGESQVCVDFGPVWREMT